MKLKTLINVNVAAALLLSFVTACSVEDTHDLSKDIDMTVAVGNGISLPLGSTEQIMLTEMIDPESSDVLETDATGNYVIKKGDDIDETSVEIKEVDVTVKPISHSEMFDLYIVTHTKEEMEHAKAEVIAIKADMEKQALDKRNEAKVLAEKTKNEAIAEAEKVKADAYKRADDYIIDPVLNAAAKKNADDAYQEALVTINKKYAETINAVDEAYVVAINEIDEQYRDVLAKYDEALATNVELGEIEHEITGEEAKINYDLFVDVPEEVKDIETVDFEEPADLTIDIAIAVHGEGRDDFSDLVNTINLYGNDNEEKFYIGVPNFIVFEEGADVVSSEDGTYKKLYIQGGATHKDDNNKNIKHLTRTFKIKGFDFTKDDVEIENGAIAVNKEFAAEGRIVANAIEVSLANALKISDVTLDATVSLGKKQNNGEYLFTLKKIKGLFAPEIDPISIDEVDLDLGEDMDFVYENGAIFDFANPQVNLVINSGVALETEATIVLRSFDDKGNEITTGKGVQIPLTIFEGENIYNITNDFFAAGEPNLSSLLAKIPHSVKIEDIKPKIADKVQEVTLGENMKISGSYDINIPMIFNEVKLTYTETIEDVLGETPEDITDYVSEIKSVLVEFEALNTVPADFNVDIVALDKNNRKINGVVANLVDEDGRPQTIKAGKGHNEAPVATNVKIELSVADGQIEKICNLDIKLNGHGYNVTLNENAYIELKNIEVTIEEPIIVDMN